MRTARRGLAIVAVAAALGVLALVARDRSLHHPSAAVAPSADVGTPTAPYHERRRFPNLVEDAPAPPSPARPGPAQAPVPPPPSRAAPPPQIADDRPPPAPPQTGGQWITGYRDAVCGCKTRGCVRDLQARFLNALGTTNYDRERDEALYVAQSREAIACYTALPEDS